MTIKADIETTLKVLECTAFELGLMPANAKLEYVPGSRQNGNAPQVRSVDRERGHTVVVYFLPKFNHTQSAKTVLVAVDATLSALYAVLRDRNR